MGALLLPAVLALQTAPPNVIYAQPPGYAQPVPCTAIVANAETEFPAGRDYGTGYYVWNGPVWPRTQVRWHPNGRVKWQVYGREGFGLSLLYEGDSKPDWVTW